MGLAAPQSPGSEGADQGLQAGEGVVDEQDPDVALDAGGELQAQQLLIDLELCERRTRGKTRARVLG